MMKNKYPNDYKNITIVFNDVDTTPRSKGLFNYDTNHGTIKHFYGFAHTLGGIVSIKGGDFEKLNGFPNFWAWGFEDNSLNIRAISAGITIDRTQFYKSLDKNVLQMSDGVTRDVNRSEFNRYMNRTGEGITSICNLTYTIDESSGFVNVETFDTGVVENENTKSVHDLRKGPTPFNVNTGRANAGRRNPVIKMFV
jgi:hypothetical protein